MGTDVARFAFSAIIGACIAPRSVEKHTQREEEDAHHDAEDAVRRRDNSVARSAVLRRKELRGDRVEHTVHHVAREREAAVPAQ